MSSTSDAQAACRAFAAVKRRTLKRVGLELLTKRDAITKLRKTFVRMQAAYLRLDGTTYSDWLGSVQLEWLEVLVAAEDDAIWDRLVDRCSEAA